MSIAVPLVILLAEAFEPFEVVLPDADAEPALGSMVAPGGGGIFIVVGVGVVVPFVLFPPPFPALLGSLALAPAILAGAPGAMIAPGGGGILTPGGKPPMLSPLREGSIIGTGTPGGSEFALEAEEGVKEG